MSTRTLLLVGTRKGAFILESDAARADWSLRGPFCDGFGVHDLERDPASGTIFAAGDSPWYGGVVWRSDDLGATWTHSSEGLTYGEDGPKMASVWSLKPVDGTLYAGVQPAGLFRSADGGATWEHVEGLTAHPTREQWQPGAGGLILHTIVPHPDDRDRMWVGISAVGVFETRDGGATWSTRNRNVRAEFMPERYPEFGQCVHKLVRAAGEPESLYQQNHCGVYRSADGGENWEEISAGLPSDFGFVMVAHPRDPASTWVIPLTSPEDGRMAPDAALAVWRTTDRGATWTRHGDGLPQEDAYVGVLREAMAIDRHDPAGIYFGTSTGDLYASADEGRSWTRIADHLPSIWAVEAVVLGD
jgi:photosystem II stability/assembly factor-like uncharacterized protein